MITHDFSLKYMAQAKLALVLRGQRLPRGVMAKELCITLFKEAEHFIRCTYLNIQRRLSITPRGMFTTLSLLRKMATDGALVLRF